MVFSSIPLYLDPPTWNQHHAQQTTTHNGNGGGDAAHLPPPPSMAPTPRPELGSPGSIKPGSMADRARLAKAPPPEPSLKCPRCESTNTKFCYYNNYSLSQPRHFCKTCRRYWTRGGALRNVPVGGGCRRNKRSKASSSTSSKSTSAASTAPSSSSIAAGVIPQPPHLPFMASLHAFGDYTTTSIGLNFGGIQPIDHGAMEYQAGGSSNLGLDQWKLQHHQMQPFSFMGGLEPVQGLLPFDEEGGQGPTGYPVKQSSSALISQLAAVKMEDDSQGLSLPRHYLGIPGNDQYWSGPASGTASGCGWTTDLSGFSSSTSGSLL